MSKSLMKAMTFINYILLSAFILDEIWWIYVACSMGRKAFYLFWPIFWPTVFLGITVIPLMIFTSILYPAEGD